MKKNNSNAQLLAANYYGAVERKSIFILFGVLMLFLMVKAIQMPVLHDEIATFFYYVQSDNFLPPTAHWDANNHILNSFLTNISYHLFGNSPLALRLPNVLSFGLYLFAAYHLTKNLKSHLIRWGTLLALICSHYLVEYFAESRGYGMSIAFLMVGLFFFQQLRLNNRIRDLFGILICITLAAAANLTLVIPGLIIYGLIILHLLLQYSTQTAKKKIQQFLISLLAIIPFYFLIEISFAFKERGAFYYGSDNGFYEVTVQTLSRYFIGAYNSSIAFTITILSVLIFGFLAFTFIRTKKRLHFLLSPTGIYAFLFSSLILSIFALYFVLGINFPEDRVAMHLYPLFILGLGFTFQSITQDQFPNMKWAGIIFFLFPILFLFHLHPKSSVFSTQERTSPEIFDYIQSQPDHFKFPHTVGGYKTQEFCWYYLNSRNGGNEGKIHTNYHIALDADYQIVRDGKIEDSALFNYYTPVLNDPFTELTLFERKSRLEPELLDEKNAVTTPGVVDFEFHNILEMTIAEHRNKTMYIGAEMTLNAAPSPFIAWLAITINDDEGTSLYSDYIPLDWLRKNWKGENNNVCHGILMHDIPPEAETLKFYLWNIEQKDYSIPNGKCYLYELKRDFPNRYN